MSYMQGKGSRTSVVLYYNCLVILNYSLDSSRLYFVEVYPSINKSISCGIIIIYQLQNEGSGFNYRFRPQI